MNTVRLSLIALAGSVAVAAAVIAQDAAPAERGPHGGGKPRMSPIVAVLDVNQDGILDATEIANAANALLALDANGDGQLTAEELRPAPPAGGPREGEPRRKGPRGPRPEAAE